MTDQSADQRECLLDLSLGFCGGSAFMARLSAAAGLSGYREIGLLLRGFSGLFFDDIDGEKSNLYE